MVVCMDKTLPQPTTNIRIEKQRSAIGDILEVARAFLNIRHSANLGLVLFERKEFT